MEPPIFDVHLQCFICARQWVKFVIPNTANLISPLPDFLGMVYNVIGNCKTRAVLHFQIVILRWPTKEEDCFEKCKKPLIIKYIHLTGMISRGFAFTQTNRTSFSQVFSCKEPRQILTNRRNCHPKILWRSFWVKSIQPNWEGRS